MSASKLTLADLAALSGDPWILHKNYAIGLIVREEAHLLLMLFLADPQCPRWVRRQNTRAIPAWLMRAYAERHSLPKEYSSEKPLAMPDVPRQPRSEESSRRQVTALKAFSHASAMYLPKNAPLYKCRTHDDSEIAQKTFTGQRVKEDADGKWRDTKTGQLVTVDSEHGEYMHTQSLSQSTKLIVDSHYNAKVKVGKRYTTEAQRQVTQAPRAESERQRDDLRNCALFFAQSLNLLDQQAAELLRALLIGCTAEDYRNIRGLSVRRIRFVKDHIAKFFPNLKLYPLKEHGVLLAGSAVQITAVCK
jgi:hypothetical protein